MAEERQNRCIYIQKSSSKESEKEMVRIVTLLRKYLDMLEENVAAVRDHKRPCDADCCLEQFTLFNLCRNTTMELMDSIAIWQQGFTRVLRPILLECDYIIKLIKGADFFEGTLLRRIFNFSLGKKNFLFLPMPNPKTIEPVVVSPQLADQVKQFAAPPLEKVLACYQILINSLPKNIYNKVLPLEHWLQNRWVPKIQFGSTTALADSQSKYLEAKRLRAEMKAKKLAAMQQSKNNSMSEFDLKMMKAKERERRKSAKLASLSSSKSLAGISGKSEADNSGDEEEEEEDDKFSLAARLNMFKKAQSNANLTAGELVREKSVLGRTLGDLEEDGDEEFEAAEFEKDFKPPPVLSEEEMQRLQATFIPREKVSMFEAVVAYEIDQALSLTESSISVAPPNQDTLQPPTTEGTGIGKVDGDNPAEQTATEAVTAGKPAGRRPQKSMYMQQYEARNAAPVESAESIAARMLQEDDWDASSSVNSGSNRSKDASEAKVVEPPVVEVAPAVVTDTDEAALASPTTKLKPKQKRLASPTNKTKLAGASLSGSAGQALLRNKALATTGGRATTSNSNSRPNSAGDGQAPSSRSKGLLVSRLAAMEKAAEEAAVVAATQASIDATKLSVEERAARMSIRTDMFRQHMISKHHQIQDQGGIGVSAKDDMFDDDEEEGSQGSLES